VTTFTLDEVADSLGVSARTVQQWISDGELRAVNVSRSRSSRKPRLRIRQEDLDAFIAGRAVGSDPPRPRRPPRRDIPRYV
jgi:excisionase family DNA binding protein